MIITISSLDKMVEQYRPGFVDEIRKIGTYLDANRIELSKEQASDLFKRYRIRSTKSCSSCGKPTPAPITPPPQLPSNWQMFKNLVSAAADAVKGGLDVRGPEETEAILAICAKCPKLVTDDRGLRCGSCGCYLGGATVTENPDGTKSYSSQFGKTSLKSWHCPLGKW